MKKVIVIGAVLAVFLFLVGCLDYKAYEIPKDNATSEDQLVNEIAQIEKQMEQENASANIVPSEVEKEVALPELGKEPIKENISEEGLEVLRVKENELVKLKLNISDPDKDVITYSLSKPFDKNGEWKTNYGDAGEYIVTITVTDSKLTTEKKFKLVVERVNMPPVITNLRDLYINEGDTVTIDPKVTDPNNDPVTVTISDPLKDKTWVTDHNSAGEYDIRVTATDGELENVKNFKLIVRDINVLPEISNVQDLTVKEGDLVKIEPKVTDADGDKVKVTIDDPVGNDGVWQTGYTDHGKYIITVTADDGKGKSYKKIELDVEDVNMPPEITEISVS